MDLKDDVFKIIKDFEQSCPEKVKKARNYIAYYRKLEDAGINLKSEYNLPFPNSLSASFIQKQPSLLSSDE